MAIDWQFSSEYWGTRTLETLAPEVSSQVRPAEQPQELFNYWGLDAIEKDQFTEPSTNFVSGVEISSTCIQFGPTHVLYSKLRPYLNKVIVPSVAGIGTTEWVVLEPKSDSLDRTYLAYVLRTKKFVDYATVNSTGARMPRARKDALRQANIPIPYPDDPTRSLAEQRRIVARIEALFAELRGCRVLNAKIQVETEKLFRSFVFSRNGWAPTTTPMSQLVQQKATDVAVQDEELYHFAGVKSFGRGVFSGRQIRGSETSYSRLTRVATGNFTYPKLMAWEGALGMVPAACNGHVVSPEYPVFEVDEDRVLPETLDIYFRTSTVWPMLADMSTGSNARRRRLHPDTFLALDFPLPPMSVQRQLRLAMEELSPILDENEEQTTLYDQLEQAFLAQAFRGEL